MKLPKQYLTYINNGGETEFEVDSDIGSYIILEPLASVDQFNQDIETATYVPGFLAFASDGGGEAYAFDNEGSVFMLPLIGMSPSNAIKVAKSWEAYESKKIKPN